MRSTPGVSREFPRVAGAAGSWGGLAGGAFSLSSGAAALPGTVRGDYSISKQNNLIHGSDSPESAQREIALWFKAGEVVEYAIDGSKWVFDGA